MCSQARYSEQSVLSRNLIVPLFLLCILVAVPVSTFGLTINVVDPTDTPVTQFRWLVEEDNTHPVTPGVADPASLSFSIHLSTATVIAAGDESNAAGIVVDPSKRYVVSVLPDSGYSNGGGLVVAGQTEITVSVNPLPIPTAQISVLVFHDNAPLNNAPDMPQFGIGGSEVGLEGFSIILHDAAGLVVMDAFANPVGTTYQTDPNGLFILDGDGNPVVDVIGDNVILTDANGEALIKYLAPNKYGVVVVAPTGEGWIQTSTLEGTPVVDAWVKSNEPPYLIEFGPPFPHAFYGFVKVKTIEASEPADPNAATIIGTAIKTHSKGADGFMASPGPPIPNSYIGLNQLGTGSQEYVYAGPTNSDGTFTIENVSPGWYQIVIWDLYLDTIITFHTVIVPPGGGTVDAGEIMAPQWFGQLEGYIFTDLDRDGFMDPGEAGIGLEAVNLRFRDGTIYQAAPTDPTGFYQFGEVFPFFKYLVVEVGFARFFATGATVVVDVGGPIPPDDGWVMPSDNKRNPQEQAEINPNTGNNLSRTEVAEFSGEILLEAMQLFNDNSNRIDWGKDPYREGENGGIAGIVFYATTRAENDPRLAAGEGWEPGIGRVQIVLYRDIDSDGVIDDLNGDGVPTLADVDNYPFGWADGGSMGSEDEKRNGAGTTFDPGDAIQIATTDAWDDNLPTEAPPSGFGNRTDAAEGQQTWNQVLAGEVFDGGWAIVSYFPGGMASGSSEVQGLPNGAYYIVEAVAPPGLAHAKEEDKNVDFGDSYTPGLELIPPPSVGDLHLVPDELTLFPGIEAPYAGQWRPLPDRKQVYVSEGFNAAADFFMFSYVPKAARVVGLATDDLTNAFDPTSPNYGEKFSPPWLPIAFRDFNGKEISRVYTDEFGAYNALVPSTYSAHLPIPTGVGPKMLTVCINDPGPVPDPLNPGQMIVDPHYKTQWAPQCYNFDFWPGKTTYLDTPVIPVGAFVGEKEYPLDCEFPDGTPLIYSVMGPDGGPYVSSTGQTITIESRGDMLVPNPEFSSAIPGSEALIVRDYGFGTAPGKVMLGCYELIDVVWGDDVITATIPDDRPESAQLVVWRGDNQLYSPLGVTMTVGGAAPVIHVRAGESIQDAVDAAPDHALILVDPGVYQEMVIVWKNIKLQGSGAFSTIINASPFSPTTKLDSWRTRISELVGSGDIDLLSDQDPDLKFEEGAAVTVVAKEGEFGDGNPAARIDGFIVTASTSGGGGIFVSAFAGKLEISNNRVIGNLGNLGGGIRIGHRLTEDDADNNEIFIHHNHITQNTGLQGGGGISIFKNAHRYHIDHNFICGNFTNIFGGGISHDGLSHGGKITGNCIAFNEAFRDRADFGGGGGGIAIVGERAGGLILSPGTGSVEITGNTFQGNMARSGDGGAVYAFFVNGRDVADEPGDSEGWYEIDIFNNMMINNVTALAGTISLQDAVKVNIVNNTIAHNDSTATAANAFTGGDINSTPQPAGVVGRQHSLGLANVIGGGPGPEFASFSNPVLHDCIIYENRSFYYDPDINFPIGGGVELNPAKPFWDVAALPEIPGENLDPRYCLLTDTTGFHLTNISGNPWFIDPYFNIITTAAEPTEGGNFIDINFRPLSKVGDYHIGAGSAAIGEGGGIFIGDFVQLEKDFDRDDRPSPAGGDPDIGADEKTEGDLIIDNLDAGASSEGEWLVSGGANPWETDSVYSATRDDTFTFQGPRDGVNRVYMRWTDWSSRYDMVPVEIFDGATSLGSFTVDQSENANKWVLLPGNPYTFTGIARIVITADHGTTPSTNADAVMFVPASTSAPEPCGITIIGPAQVNEETDTNYDLRLQYSDGSTAMVEADPWNVVNSGATISGTGVLTTPALGGHNFVTIMAEYSDGVVTRYDERTVRVIDLDSAMEVIVDNRDSGASQTGTWPVSGGANPWQSDSVYSSTGGNTFTFGADLVPTAYAVYARWTGWSSRRTSVPIRITSGTTDETVTVNQQQNPGMWNLLGIYLLGANTDIIITSSGGGSTNADAVRFMPVSLLTELIMDNDTPVATGAGSWGTSGGADPYGSRSLWSRDIGDTFTYAVPLTGTFTIQGWWTEWPSRHDQTPIEIWDGGTLLTTVDVNQQVNGGQWNTLTTQTFASSVRIVVESETTAFSTNADAFKLIPTP